MTYIRIFGVVVRYFYTSLSGSRLTEYLFWPLVDIAFYGLIALWSESLANEPKILFVFISALVLWQVVHRSHMEICQNLMDEFAERNFMNFVASPLSQKEWITALMISGTWKTMIIFLYSYTLAYLLFGVNIFNLGTSLLVLIPLCIINGWISGLLAGAFVILSGPKTYQVPWVVIMVCALLSTVFYPVDILPSSFQLLVSSFPMSYIFQQMRFVLTEGTLNYPLMWTGCFLTFIYLLIALKFFFAMFERSRTIGFKKSS